METGDPAPSPPPNPASDPAGLWSQIAGRAGVALSADQHALLARYLDLLLAANAGHRRLLRNDTTSANSSLRVILVGTQNNRSAIGARVAVRIGGRTITSCVKSGSSYLSESDRRLTFGLGRARRVDQVEVQWPSGAVQTLGPFPRNQVVVIQEPGTR